LTCSGGGHLGERRDDLQLAGGFAGQPDQAGETAGFQLAEGEFQHAAGFAVAGGSLKKQN
jgi:hypothetical protein